MSTPADPGATGAVPAAPLDDANDLRGFHFKRLLGKALTLALIAFFTIAAGIAGAVFLGPAIGGAAALLVLLASLAIVFAIADSRAADAFFEAYATSHGLALGGRSELDSVTPLLCRGSSRYAVRTLAGPLAEGLEGTLALFTYEEHSSDGKTQTTTYYRYTLGLVAVPECVAQVPELYCQRKFGLRALQRFEDAFRGSKKRLTLESETLEERYEIFAREGQDAVWLRRFFSPSFIVWLTDSAPAKFAFELVNGNLCCYVNGHRESDEGLDEVRTATAAVATRLREEALEAGSASP